MKNPDKIVSLVPSLTELLFDLDLDNRLAGRTRFCIHPKEKVKDVPIIGGTKNPRIEKIKQMAPDLIIANHEENRKEDIRELGEISDILLTEISNIEDALLTIYDIGRICGVQQKAEALIDQIEKELQLVPDEPEKTAAYLIWQSPWMTVGRDTYVHSVMKHWNLENVYGERTRYPKTTLEELAGKQPDLILLSSEPFPFKEKHQRQVEEACGDSTVVMVEGEWFSWYGSRMLQSFRHLHSFRKAIG